MEEGAVVENMDTFAAGLKAAEEAKPKVEPVAEAPAKVPPESGVDSKVPEEKAPKQFTPISSQEEFDRATSARLARAEAKHARELREIREANIRLEERLNAAAPPKTETTVKDGPPQLKDFTDFDEYVTAKAEWVADQRMAKSETQRTKTEAEMRAQFQAAQIAQTWDKKVEAAIKELPDYREALSNSQAPLTNAMKAFIMRAAEHGPQLAYHLATHPEVAAEIADAEQAGLTPEGVARRLTLIEAGFATKPVTRTPEPEKPTGARQTSGVRALTDVRSYDEFVKRRRDFIAKR